MTIDNLKQKSYVITALITIIIIIYIKLKSRSSVCLWCPMIISPNATRIKAAHFIWLHKVCWKEILTTVLCRPQCQGAEDFCWKLHLHSCQNHSPNTHAVSDPTVNLQVQGSNLTQDNFLFCNKVFFSVTHVGDSVAIDFCSILIFFDAFRRL